MLGKFLILFMLRFLLCGLKIYIVGPRTLVAMVAPMRPVANIRTAGSIMGMGKLFVSHSGLHSCGGMSALVINHQS